MLLLENDSENALEKEMKPESPLTTGRSFLSNIWLYPPPDSFVGRSQDWNRQGIQLSWDLAVFWSGCPFRLKNSTNHGHCFLSTVWAPGSVPGTYIEQLSEFITSGVAHACSGEAPVPRVLVSHLPTLFISFPPWLPKSHMSLGLLRLPPLGKTMSPGSRGKMTWPQSARRPPAAADSTHVTGLCPGLLLFFTCWVWWQLSRGVRH